MLLIIIIMIKRVLCFRLMSVIGIDEEEIGTDEAIQSVNTWKQGMVYKNPVSYLCNVFV